MVYGGEKKGGRESERERERDWKQIFEERIKLVEVEDVSNLASKCRFRIMKLSSLCWESFTFHRRFPIYNNLTL